MSGTMAGGAGGGGGYMGHTIVKFEGRGCSGRHEGQKRVTTTQKEKKEERGKNKKTTKKGLRRQKVKKLIFFRIWSHFASTPQPSQKDLRAAIWTTDASRFRLSSGGLTNFQFI